MNSNAVKGKIYSDVFIEANTSKFKSTSFEGAEEMYRIGYEEALKQIPRIKELLSQPEESKFHLFAIFKRNKKKVLKEEFNDTIIV